jgi:putative membrane protein
LVATADGAARYTTLVKANGADGTSGNRARDHLANERTYLAWLRTALAVVALGAVLAKLPGARSASVTAAAALALTFGSLALAYGTRRYYLVRRDLERNEFTPAGRGPLVVSVIACLCGVAVFVLLLV